MDPSKPSQLVGTRLSEKVYLWKKVPDLSGIHMCACVCTHTDTGRANTHTYNVFPRAAPPLQVDKSSTFSPTELPTGLGIDHTVGLE